MAGSVRLCNRRNPGAPLAELPLSSEVFANLIERLSLPKHALNAAAQHHDFLTVFGLGASGIHQETLGWCLHHDVLSSLLIAAAELILRLMNFDLDSCCLALSYFPESHTTHAVLLGLLPDGSRNTVQEMVKLLQANRTQAWHPMLLPKLLLEKRTALAASAVHKAIDLADKFELSRSFKEPFWTENRVNTRDPLPADFDDATIWINTLATDLSLMDLLVESLLELCSRVVTIVSLLDPINHEPFGSDAGTFTENSAPSSNILKDDISYMHGLNRALFRRVHQVQKKVQIQLAVVNTFIAQRDNTLNLSVATDSKELAIASKMDSSSMKSIAVLTMVFLPGSFIANLFSMPLFNWNAGVEDSILTARYWIYLVVTLPLTAAVLAIWIFWHWHVNEPSLGGQHHTWKYHLRRAEELVQQRSMDLSLSTSHPSHQPSEMSYPMFAPRWSMQGGQNRSTRTWVPILPGPVPTVLPSPVIPVVPAAPVSDTIIFPRADSPLPGSPLVLPVQPPTQSRMNSILELPEAVTPPTPDLHTLTAEPVFSTQGIVAI
ncbi:hypothetical protein CALVIDRAFT_556271 [Calocera viscosa TUFC12733]|uniref:Cora-domain-containing protein n=1 Tax=Calocera viscosa (strain TUFC12733) TaxID=1330018 RepID=A0A167KB75_CALVF|nr:hypothetical protein CALVIDRAFT_556271 [Calocera viscosa TUFC12733]